jgi:hypothetical protein
VGVYELLWQHEDAPVTQTARRLFFPEKGERRE